MKKILSVLVCISLCLSACLPVMASDEQIAKIAELYTYGIIEGDENGNINLVENVTRAEFCKMIFKAMAKDESYEVKSETPFDDVPADHWAYRYIDFAKSEGIVNGVGDNKFEPDSEIITQDMLKIIMIALGYDEYAKSLGGYPEGYVIAAVKWGIPIDQFSVETQKLVTRAVAAETVYNMINTPVMVAAQKDDATEYVIMNGENGTEFVTLKSALDALKNK